MKYVISFKVRNKGFWGWITSIGIWWERTIITDDRLPEIESKIMQALDTWESE